MSTFSIESEVPPKVRELLTRYGFDLSTFLRLRATLSKDPSSNLERGTITPASPNDVVTLPHSGTPRHTALTARGEQLIADGKVAVVVLCGGMATRFGGIVKAHVPVLGEQTFLDLKVRDVQHVARRLGGRVPVYLMTSFATDYDVESSARRLSSDTVPVTTFAQFISLRLTPEGNLFLGEDGMPSPYATGHGDLVPALRASGCLEALLQQGVQHLFMTNVDNLAATFDPAVIGAHVESGLAMTFEVIDNRGGDQGGAPVCVDGKLQVLEGFRMPAGLDPRCAQLFSTNTFVLDVPSLNRPFNLTWFRVDKRVEGRPAVQFERLVNQLSATLLCRALRVERDGTENRFIPIKEPADLREQRGQIEALLRRRGVYQG